MKKKPIYLVTTMVLLLLMLFASHALSQQKPKQENDWAKLKVITYASGLTGFFDPQTGIVYVYDANWDKCVFIRQLTALGEPMKRLKN